MPLPRKIERGKALARNFRVMATASSPEDQSWRERRSSPGSGLSLAFPITP